MISKKTIDMIPVIILLMIIVQETTFSQQISTTHTRGKLWETLYNYGFIGDPGAWDYNEITGIGFYPGFAGYTYPLDEQTANGFITDANFHNFRSGPWIIVKDALAPVPPAFDPQQQDFLIYQSSMATGDVGVLSNIMSFKTTRNFIDNEDFNPLLPEEINYVEFNTTTGIKIKQRSMSWSYPGYNDFIIYDYTFINTGDIAVPAINQIVHIDQTLNEVWFVFHSGIQVSTKGNLNFHYNSDFLSSAAPAGGFGWHPGGGYTDYYAIENYNPGANTPDGKGLLYYSRDYNGGRSPVPWDQFGIKNNWENLLTKSGYELPELQDPAAFGFTFLYRTPPAGALSPDPFEADPAHFNIYSDEGAKFKGKTVDFESFGLSPFTAQDIYDFALSDHLPANNGRCYCWFTSSFGPYTLQPGDSVRLIVAEIAGVMDLKEVIKGDPNHWYPDSTIADIRRNYEAVRNAVKWGAGANVNGIKLAADAPEPPPAPVTRAANTSKGSDSAIISIQWDKAAENAIITDGSGQVFYDGSTDLSGYRVFRGNDKRGIWELIATIQRSQLDEYWNGEIQKYEYEDTKLQFGFEYYYYVQAYNSNPKPWTSANGTLVENLPELKSGDYNRTPLTGAKPGPVLVKNGWDVFVAPNPYIEGDPTHSFGEPTPRKIEFRNLPERATINIYSLSGDLIKTLRHGPDSNGNLAGSISWDQRSNSGLLIAPGLYIYVVRSETEGSKGSKTTGKFMIIR